MKLAYLGPKFSHSHGVATTISQELLSCQSIPEIFDTVIKGMSQGLVPLENSRFGSVRETIMEFLDEELFITKIIDVPITHCLAAQSNDYKIIISHPQALGQCSTIIGTTPTRTSASTSDAMKMASQDRTLAAIGSKEAAEKYGLKILDTLHVPNNVTRFAVIATKLNHKNKSHTGLIINPQKDEPGLLFRILSSFATHNINLCKIESLPSQTKLGVYQFYVEIECPLNNKRLEAIIEFLIKSGCIIQIVGNYDIAK